MSGAIFRQSGSHAETHTMGERSASGFRDCCNSGHGAGERQEDWVTSMFL